MTATAPRAVALVLSLFFVRWSSLTAQEGWNSAAALTLARRGVERREAVQADPTLQSYRTRAHGFVFFLTQIGREGLGGPPRLVKADELDVEVYWQAPNRSKQVIHGWRDGSFLPTDIAYHRDHLGIVTNNFGDLIRIGEGDEVRDAVHPLSPAGLDAYDFSLGDSLTIRGPRGDVKVRELLIRPRRYDRPLVVGSLYLDAESAELVRFRFSFTPAAYLERNLEDISVVLENSLQEGRFWLPYRQEIEIRRRASWFDFPVRGIIRGRWEIGDYEFNVPLPPSVLEGPEIGGLTEPQPTDSAWPTSLRDAIAAEAAPIDRQDMEALRVDISRLASTQRLSGLPPTRLAFGSVSDLIHVNRVQGLTLGLGGSAHFGRGRFGVRPTIAFGTSDQRVTGGIELTAGRGATELGIFGQRRIRDLSDIPVISGALNSLLAQENGDDYGDYVLLDAAGARVRHRLGSRLGLGFEAGVEHSSTLDVEATPARGSYRPNPPLGAGTYGVLRARLERAGGGLADAADLTGSLAVEAGEGPTSYARVLLDASWRAPLGGSALAGKLQVGMGTDGLPAYRGFVLGGRGTLVGEPFRGFGGRSYALAELEWRIDVPAPAFPLGSFASTGNTMVLAPFLAAGWSERPYDGLPWPATDGVRPVAGVALEFFLRLLRVEAGIGLRDGDFGLTFDVHPDWWGVL
jgi:hypothetical protein